MRAAAHKLIVHTQVHFDVGRQAKVWYVDAISSARDGIRLIYSWRSVRLCIAKGKPGSRMRNTREGAE